MSHLAGKRPSNNSDVKHGSCFPHTLPGLISTFSTRMLVRIVQLIHNLIGAIPDVWPAGTRPGRAIDPAECRAEMKVSAHDRLHR